jgi:deoxyribonuclease-4
MKMMTKLRFGTGGTPLTAKGWRKGPEKLQQLGLHHMELEFVQSVFLNAESAAEMKALATAHDVSLSVHGSYYTNFASPEREKRLASTARIVKAAQMGSLAGARSITYHTGFFQGQTFSEIKPIVLESMREIIDQLRELEAPIKLAPELTGKASQVGDLPQLIELIAALRDEGYSEAALCIDFAHNYARHGGKYNTYDEFMQMLEDIEKGLGAKYLEELHIHISAIEYGDKGEKNHLLLMPTLEDYRKAGFEVAGMDKVWAELKANRFIENKFNWRDLLRALKAGRVGGFVVCESPILELDALVMQRTYEEAAV